jgi:tetratricopeptide (TPR) repeat protein
MLAWRRWPSAVSAGLGDAAGAFAAAGQALRAAVAEPEAPQLVAHVERLAAVIDREADLIDLYRDLAPDVLDAELQRRLQLDIADLARGVRGDVALAREYYQRVLDGAARRPSGAAGSREHLSLRRRRRRRRPRRRQAVRGAHPQERMDWASDDERVAALAEAATLAEGPLGRDVDAALAWEQVLEAEPQRRDAGEALERVYRRMGRHNDLVELYERRLGFAASVEEAGALRVTLAELQLTELRDPAAAIDSYGAALSGDTEPRPGAGRRRGLLDEASVRAEAADLLEPIYVARQAWPQLIRVYEGEARGRDRARRAPSAHAVPGPPQRGAARGSRAGQPLVRAPVPRGPARRRGPRAARSARQHRRELGLRGRHLPGVARRRAGPWP